jgi:hypothetical protein
MEMGIRAAVLVDHRLAVAQGQDASYRLALLGSYPYARILADTLDDITKPL